MTLKGHVVLLVSKGMENSVVLRKGLFDLEEYSMTLDSLLFENLYEKR